MISLLYVLGHSMEPYCKEGDYLAINKMSHWLSQFRLGDVVAVSDPEMEGRVLCKRISAISPNRKLYWVEGDNTLDSRDSRAFGWIPRNRILGRAKVIHRPGVFTRGKRMYNN